MICCENSKPVLTVWEVWGLQERRGCSGALLVTAWESRVTAKGKRRESDKLTVRVSVIVDEQ